MCYELITGQSNEVYTYIYIYTHKYTYIYMCMYLLRSDHWTIK